MPDHVGQTLLKNSESRGGSIPIQMQIDRGNRDLAANSIASRKLAGLPFNRSRQAKVVQDSRPQPAAYRAHGIDAIIDQLNRFLQSRKHLAFRLRQMTSHPRHIHFDRGQNLPDLVVQVTSDSLAVLFAHPLQPFSQRPQLFFLQDERLFSALTFRDVAIDHQHAR